MSVATTRGGGHGTARTVARRTPRTGFSLAVLFLLHSMLTGGISAATPLSDHSWGVVAWTSATPAAALDPEPLIVEGDPISRVVGVLPDSSTVFAIGAEGLYRSGDGGDTWRSVGPPPPAGRVVAGEDGALLLAGSRPPCARGGDEPPLSRSDDGGATWQTVAGTTGVLPLAIWGGADLALGADCAGLLLATESGRSWQPAPVTEPGYEVTAFAPLSGVAPTAPAGLVVGTSEGGTSQVWLLDLSDPTRPAVGPALTRFWGAGAPAGHAERLSVGTSQGVLVSTDGGGSWTLSRLGLEDVTLSVDPFQGPIPDQELRRGFGIGAVAIDPAAPDHLYAGTVDGLFESVDGGATWQRVAGVDGRVTGLVLAPATGRLFAETEAGVVVVPTGA